MDVLRNIDVLGLLALVAVTAAFTWLARRAWRAHNPVVKLLGSLLAGLLALILVAVFAISLIGYYKTSVRSTNPVAAVPVVAAVDFERGPRLAYLCVSCHSSTGDLPLDGGQTNLAAAFGPIATGNVIAPNLTPGGHLDDVSDAQLIQAIREGIDEDGRPLVFMPTSSFRNLSDADVQALVAYLRSQPSSRRETPPVRLNVVGAFLTGIGLIPSLPAAPIVEPILAPEGGSAGHGQNLVAIAGCRDCHGQDLAGGRLGGVGPEAANLTTHLKDEDAEALIRLMRSGVDHEGEPIDPDDMPWRDYGRAFTDDDLRAMFAYLHGLQPIETPPSEGP